MKAMDPIELLRILSTCHFGKFCSKKFLSIVHPKTKESLFGDSVRLVRPDLGPPQLLLRPRHLPRALRHWQLWRRPLLQRPRRLPSRHPSRNHLWRRTILL
ncbi:Protein GRAVITROPIC IN THE LIGHT 1 [Camellia lanceoleosa]|uniref:Protein GRAVITROPIC IN THE LIGHT 1 n=1 Tax=Camellia lanceoleosa TaxID=1840588 RepID=A0ACC0GDS7_9ERIC|nr:Protein GRAVITROPIC IN THE LIGHT 1 [Camellia lanceoleosa]